MSDDDTCYPAMVMKSQDMKIADLQRLCERAYLLLSENWSECIDDDGYGPSSLLRDLKNASLGKEYRELQAWNNYLLTKLNNMMKPK